MIGETNKLYGVYNTGFARRDNLKGFILGVSNTRKN